MDLKKFGSFLVPLVSDLSLGFCPGTSGDRPVFHIVGSAAVEQAGLDRKPAEIRDVAMDFVRSLRDMNLLDETILCSSLVWAFLSSVMSDS